MKHDKIRILKGLLPIDHSSLQRCSCFSKTKHCTSSSIIGAESSWKAFVRLPDGVELEKTGQTPSLVFATTKYGGYRIIMPCGAETQIRELTRHQTLRAAGKITFPLNESLYDHLLQKWGRNARKLKTLLGCEALEYFFEVVEIYSQEMLPYVLGCGEPPDEDAKPDFRAKFETVAEA